MKNVANFCKLYLPEILFAVATLLCTGTSMYGIFCLPQITAMGISVFTVIALAVLGYYFQKLEKTVSQPSKVFMIVWYTGFAVLMLTLIVSISIIYMSSGKFSFYILLTISGTVFVAMFGHLVIVSNVPSQKIEYPTVTTDTCDNNYKR